MPLACALHLSAIRQPLLLLSSIDPRGPVSPFQTGSLFLVSFVTEDTTIIDLTNDEEEKVDLDDLKKRRDHRSVGRWNVDTITLALLVVVAVFQIVFKTTFLRCEQHATGFDADMSMLP